MHVLTVLDHPNPKSFTAAAAEHFIQRAHAGGHPVELADLNAEGFNPLWAMANVEGTSEQADIVKEQTRIARADAICLMFPLF